MKVAAFCCAAALAAGFPFCTAAPAAGASGQDAGLVARGRYLVKLGGCNDCHTDGFTAADAKTPEKDWLEGSRLGWHGPWGTTYSVNLRLLVHGMTEAQWLEEVRTMRPKPPMPWWSLRWMTPEDQRAVYAFIRYLGPAGSPAPDDLPPGAAPSGPAVSFPMPPK